MTVQAPVDTGTSAAASRLERLRDRLVATKFAPLSPAQYSVVVPLVTVFVLAVWFVFYLLVLSGVQEAHDQRVDFAHLREKLALATVPIGGQISPGTPVALLSFPALDKSRIVVDEGTSSSVMERGPGHSSDTALPGQAGVSVIYGRSTTFGAPFGSIDKLKTGDAINVATGQGTFTYSVVDVRRPGDPVPSSLSSASSLLVLETAQAKGWTHLWVPGQVLYVDAALSKGTVQPAPSGRPTSVPASYQPFHGDTGKLIQVALWLQLLVLFVAVTGWAWVRWTKQQTWLVAVPAAMAILWCISSAVAPLLPNLT